MKGLLKSVGIVLIVLALAGWALAGSANKSMFGSTKQPGGVLIIDDLAEHPNQIWFVDSGATNAADAVSSGRNPNVPFATLDYAISHAKVTADDTIYVMPGHSENIATGTTIDVDVAGISIIGLGSGSLRPRFDFDAADSAFDIGDNDCLIRNLTFRPGITATLIGIDIESGVTGTVIEDCEFLVGEDAGTDEFVLTIKLVSGNHDTIIRRNTFRTDPSDGDCTDCIDITAAASRVRIEDNVFVGNWSTAAISDGAACADIYIVRNNIKVADGEPGIELTATTKGIIADNNIESTGATADTSIVAADCSWFRNWCVLGDGLAAELIGTQIEVLGANTIVATTIGADAITNAKIADAAISEEQIDADAATRTSHGITVAKATGAIAGAGTIDIFEVAGGLVLITSLVGEVTVQMGADQDTTLEHEAADIAALLACDSDAVGTLYGCTGAPGDAIIAGTATVQGMAQGIICNAGTIEHVSAGNTFAGEVTWRLTYIPLETGATVTPSS